MHIGQTQPYFRLRSSRVKTMISEIIHSVNMAKICIIIKIFDKLWYMYIVGIYAVKCVIAYRNMRPPVTIWKTSIVFVMPYRKHCFITFILHNSDNEWRYLYIAYTVAILAYSVASWRHAIVAAHKSNRFPFDRRINLAIWFIDKMRLYNPLINSRVTTTALQ